MSEKKTYGQLVNEHRSKNLEIEDDVIEYRRVMEPDIITNMWATIDAAKKSPVYSNRDFYIVLAHRVERIGQGYKALPIARISCPTPTYKQSVFKYHYVSGDLEFLWSIPSEITYYYILRNAPKLLLDKECASITKFCMLMENGELLNWVKKENGEKPDAVLKIIKEPLHA